MTVRKWSGRETRALREAKRMSVREFAAHLGVSDRTVSKWEAGGDQVQPRPDSQAMLDTVLERATDEARRRFELLVQAQPPAVHDPTPASEDPKPLEQQQHYGADGRLMALVPAGVFLSGRQNRAVWLPDFFIDVTPVSNVDYANFLAATGHAAPPHWADDRCPAGLEQHPVVNVTHHDAVAYCRWAGKQLPTADQWEKAARGTTGATYPWGDQPTHAKCNVRESGIGHTTPVERYHSGTSPYGVYDLAGNVWEWCATETESGRFVLKGSAFTSPFSMAAAAATNDAAATMLDDDTGFRCVMTGHPTVEPPSR